MSGDEVCALAAQPRSKRYALMQRVSGGQFGEIWLAIDRMTNARVAVKKQELSSEAAARELSSLSALGAFPHVNVVVMKDYYVLSAHLFTIYDALPTTLWHIWKSHDCQFQQLPVEVVGKYMAGVASGIGHMHDHNIVHGDASLANMLVDADGVVKVADFGSAHSCQGFVLGDSKQVTTQYVRAPEKLLGQFSSSSSTDVWAVGVQTLALFTGKIPWAECKDPASVFDILMTEILGPIGQSSPEFALSLYPWPGHEELPSWKQVQAKHRMFKETFLLGQVAWSVENCIGALHSRPALDSEHFVPAVVAMLKWSPADRPSLRRMLDYVFFLAESSYKKRRVREGSLGLGSPSSSSLEQVALTDTGLGSTGLGSTGLASTRPDAKAETEASNAEEELTGLESKPGLASTKPAVQREGGNLCQCSGNCGWKLCGARSTQKAMGRMPAGETICMRVSLPGAKFCLWCKCDVLICVRPRRRCVKGGLNRWCKSCRNTWASQLSTTTWISSSGEAMKLSPRSSIQCKLVLRMMWVLRLVWPADLTTCLQVSSHFQPTQGGVVDSFSMVCVFLAQTIKWPPAVLHFLGLIRDARWPREDARVMSQTMLDIYVCVIRWCDGKDWGDMFDRMHGKPGKQRMDAVCGINNSAKSMGILKKSQDKSGLRLGRGQGAYAFAEGGLAVGQRIFQYMFERAAVLTVTWPSSAVDTQAFGDSLLSFAREVRSYKVEGRGLTGGKDPEYAYNAKSFVRIMMMQALQLCPAALDTYTVKEVLEWTPDEKNRLQPFEHMTGLEVKNAFDVDAMMFACWLCMVHMNLEDKTVSSALRLEDSYFYDVVDEYRKNDKDEGFIFPPGAHLIPEMALLRAKSE